MLIKKGEKQYYFVTTREFRAFNNYFLFDSIQKMIYIAPYTPSTVYIPFLL